MKKKYLVGFLLVAFIAAALTLSSRANSSVDKSDMITALRYFLSSELNRIVEEKHGVYAKVDYWDVDILSIKKLTEGEHMGSLEMEVAFIPYIGPHNSISKDRAKLIITLEGIELLEYVIEN